MTVELGGSAVNNLADNLQLFGLAPGSTNLFAATYTVVRQHREVAVPRPRADVLSGRRDPRHLVRQGARRQRAGADRARSAEVRADERRSSKVVSRKSWDIQFADRQRHVHAAGRRTQLKKLLNDLVVAGGTLVEIHGHTDNQGTRRQRT